MQLSGGGSTGLVRISNDGGSALFVMQRHTSNFPVRLLPYLLLPGKIKNDKWNKVLLRIDWKEKVVVGQVFSTQNNSDTTRISKHR
eukprot:840827-Amphidinium_carterae.1